MRKTRSTAASAEIIHSINKSFTLCQNSNVVYIIRAKLINSVIFRSWEWRRVESQFTFYCQQTWHSPQETGWAGDATTSLSPSNLQETKNTTTQRELENKWLSVNKGTFWHICMIKSIFCIMQDIAWYCLAFLVLLVWSSVTIRALVRVNKRNLTWRSFLEIVQKSF